jgi:hypothetical protein
MPPKASLANFPIDICRRSPRVISACVFFTARSAERPWRNRSRITETVPSNLRCQTRRPACGFEPIPHRREAKRSPPSSRPPSSVCDVPGLRLWGVRPKRFGPCLSHPSGFIHLLSLADQPDWVSLPAVAQESCSFPRAPMFLRRVRDFIPLSNYAMTILQDCPAIRVPEGLLPASDRTGSAQKKCLTYTSGTRTNRQKNYSPSEERGGHTSPSSCFGY